MKALITGASSGIGKDMAIYLGELGYDLILVARREDKLKEVAKQIKTKVKIISLDISTEQACKELYEKVKKDNVDILINNAGFGLYGEFYKTDLEKEVKMIDLNIKAVHILTKLFLKDMIKKNSGYILNVSSSAAFAPGPLMATYYSTKAYVLRLTESIYGELKNTKTKVSVSVLCPGPIKTEFFDVAKVNFAIKGISSEYVAKYAIDKMFKKKLIIVPSLLMKFARIFVGIIPKRLLIKITYKAQKKKEK